MQSIQLALASAALMVGTMIAWSALARPLGLIDLPDGGRKQHRGAIPLAGGPALLTVLLVTGAALPAALVDWKLLLVACMTVGIGSIDDRVDLSASLRLFAQLVMAMLVVLVSGYVLVDLGEIAANGATFALGASGPWITIAAIAAAMNAFNMLDGTDGQTAGIALVALLGLLLAAVLSGSAPTHLLIVTASALPVFLFFNLRAADGKLPKSFLGDSGAMLLGLIVGVCLIGSAQGESAFIKPVTALWLAALPIFDTFFVMTYRIVQGRSPLSADRNHVHHLLVDHGLKRPQALAAVLSGALMLAIVGLALDFAQIPDAWSFALIGLVFVVYVSAALSAHRRRPSFDNAVNVS